MPNCAAGKNRHVGGAATDIHQTYAQLLLIFRQYRLARCQRLQNHFADLQPATMHAFQNILHRSHRADHDMHLNFQLHPAHAQRFFDTFLTVDGELLLDDMQRLLIAGQTQRAGSLHHAIDIRLRYFFILDLDHALAVGTFDMAAGDAGNDRAYFAVGHQLRRFQ